MSIFIECLKVLLVLPVNSDARDLRGYEAKYSCVDGSANV